MTDPVLLLGPGHHLYASRRIDGFSSCVHRAELRDEHGRPFTAYVKAFPTDKRGLANEVAGWLITRALGLPCPPRAYLCLVPVRKLRQLFPERRWPGNDDDNMTCFASEELPNNPLALVNEQDAIVWRARIKPWPHLHAIIALCHWLHNIDGNGGNLLYLGDSDFAIIDHAEILGGQDWTPKTLRHAGYLHNQAMHLAYGGLPPPQATQDIEAKSAAHLPAWQKAKEAVLEWWQELLSRKECSAAVSFIEARADPAWIKGKIA